MAIGLYRARVTRISDLTHDVRELDLTLAEPGQIQFKAGQFISFEIPKEGAPFPLTRPYSIASPPSVTNRVTILFNLVTGGPGSTYLYGLHEGDSVEFKGPAGSFYLREEPARQLLFVATGTGIAPIRAMLLTQFERYPEQPMTLFWGLRYARDLYYQEELSAWAARHPRFTFITTLSRPEPGWTSEQGRVTDLVQARIQSVRDLAVYLCGNGDMLKDVTGLIQAKGLCPIYREKYY